MRNRIPTIVSRFGILVLVLLSLTLVSCAGDTRSPSEAESATVEPTATEPTSSTRAATTTTGTPVLVYSIAGIRLGESTDPDVVAMYGPGLTMPRGFHSDGRYYTDAAHTVTLLVGAHTDGIVVTVQLSDGVALPPGLRVDDYPALTASSLSLPVPTEHGITLGMSASEVLKRLGQPEIDETEGIVRVLAYQAEEELPDTDAASSYFANYTFVRDQLRSVSINLGE